MSKILAIVGPTGGGKSDLALALAERLDGEIISCDSMQVYRRMDIGTAKPTAEEQARVKHHLIDVCEPDEPFSAADYVLLASKAIDDCQSRNKLPIICGGTGLYLDALMRKNDFEPNTTDPNIRQELMDFAEANGADALWQMLYEIDKDSAEATHKNNIKRVARAIEIYKVSGSTKTELDRRSRMGGIRYDMCVIGIRYANREDLYKRINRRVDIMLERGLAEETHRLLVEGVFEKNSTAAQAIGYKEILPLCRGEETLETSSERLKMATRRYAKRQMTWFLSKEYVNWIDVDADGKKTFEEIVNNAEELFKKS